MEDSSRGAASFFTQADALLRLNTSIQKRSVKTNMCVVSFPIGLCLLMLAVQVVVNREFDKPERKCGCKCVDTKGDGSCEKVCGIQYSPTARQAFTCAVPEPPEWPPLMQVPHSDHGAVRRNTFTGLPEGSCRKTRTCPSIVLITGADKAFATNVAENFFSDSLALNPSTYSDEKHGKNLLNSLANMTLGTDTFPPRVQFIEPAFLSERTLYDIRSRCDSSSESPIQVPLFEGMPAVPIGKQCLRGLNVWRDNVSAINDELFEGYRQANTDGSINGIMAAYDFMNSRPGIFNVIIWYNSTYKNDSLYGYPPARLRVSRSVNMASNAYLQYLNGSDMKVHFNFTKEMPKPATQLSLEFSSLLGGLFITWIIKLLFPVFLTYLVYEKQKKLRIMMQMHGLSDGPYWIISYSYFLLVSCIYVLLLVAFGSLIKLKFFTLNDYSIQFVFFFAYINLQIALAFLLSAFFSKVKSAQGFAYTYVFSAGLLAEFLLWSFIGDLSFARHWVTVMELIPGFSLYRGLYEFSNYSFVGSYMGTHGMRWKDLSDKDNGMKEALIIIIVEWVVFLPLAYYLDQLASVGNRTRNNPLHFLQYLRKKTTSSFKRQSHEMLGSKIFVDIEKPDVIQEREVVEQLLLEPNASYTIVSDNLSKVYAGHDGNPDKLAVQGLSLAVPRGECCGILGPNGAGKTSFINMMIGLVSPTSGNAYVNGYNIETNMNKIYTSMGVCPQNDMLWEKLTGREHLLFYGRLKNLKGSSLLQAVEDSLRSVNLFFGGVADKLVGKYSGGMKRRLSVAISLIGDPKVVYMDEPSTGLDPASRSHLWNVVKKAKQNRAIILTTHSMEEAEILCDRLGIFIAGSMQCIGNPKQLKARYGGSYIFTMTTSQDKEHEVEKLVHHLSPNANKMYHIAGTQKFEIPKQGVTIANVFGAVENAKKRFPIQAWGLADTTLEDVFIKVAKEADSLYM